MFICTQKGGSADKEGFDSWQPVVFYFTSFDEMLWVINKSWSMAQRADGLNLSGREGRLMSTVLRESGHSVWSQSQHSLPHCGYWCLAIPLWPSSLTLQTFPPSSLSLCSSLSHSLYPKWFNYHFPGVRQMKGKRDGSVVPNLIIYLLNRLLRYSPWAVVTDGCWEVKWAKCLVRTLPATKLMQRCIGNWCQIQIGNISFK